MEEVGMASQNQESLESGHISLLHEKILSDNNHFVLNSQLSQKVLGRNESQGRPRHTSNTKAQRMKPASTAPVTATATMDSPELPHPPLVKHTTFHGFPIEMDGDTQPMPSQFYKNYTSGAYPAEDDDTQIEDGGEEDGHQETEIDLMQHWPEPTYHEISSDNGSDSGRPDEAQYFFSSVNRPTAYPKTPATACRKLSHRGELISTSSTKTPGSGGLSAFAFGTAAPLTATQLFQATQAPSSPVPEGLIRSDPVLSRPSPNLRTVSSPAVNGGFSSPLKQMLQSPVVGKLRRPRIMTNGKEEADVEMDDGEKEVWEDEHQVQEDAHDSGSPGSDSMDEYDEFAQDIRPSQRLQSSPRSLRFDGETEHVRSSSRTPDSQRHDAPTVASSRQQAVRQSSQPRIEPMNPEDTQFATVADSQPVRNESETQPPPPLVEPSSLSSFVPGSYPLGSSQMRRILTRGPDDSSSIPRPPPTTSQAEPQTQQRLPSSPPQLPAVSEEDPPSLNLESQAQSADGANAPASSPLPETRANESREASQQYISNISETDAVLRQEPSNEKPDLLNGQSVSLPSANPTLAPQHIATSPNDPSPAFSPLTQPTNNRVSQLSTQSPHQSQRQSQLSAESPRRAAGILRFADIATDPTPPEAKELDVDIDLLSNEDMDFMDAMSSPPAKRMKMYGKKARLLEKAKEKSPAEKTAESPVESPVKSPIKSAMKKAGVRFQDIENGEEEQHEAHAEEPAATEVLPRIATEHAPEQQNQSNGLDVINEAIREQVEAVEDAPDTAGPIETIDSFEPVQSPKDQPSNENQISAPEPRLPTPLPLQTPTQTPPSVRKREEAGAQAAAKARDALLARKKQQSRTPESNAKGRLVRPKKRDGLSPLRTPVSRRQETGAPGSRLRHVERMSSDGVQPTEQENVTVEPSIAAEQQPVEVNSVVEPAVAEEEHDSAETDGAVQQHQPAETVASPERPQSRRTDDTTDTFMTDAASERPESRESESVDEITQPDRVLALFKGTGQAYYPATCLGSATLDGQKLRIRFDDGTTTQLDSSHVRRLEFRRGDQVKVDLKGMRSKAYTVMSFEDKVQDADPESYPKTEIHGFETVQLVLKDRDSTAAVPRIETAALLKVPVTNVYLTQTMWIRFDSRVYMPSTTTSMTATSINGRSSRTSTPIPQHIAPTTPASRARRPTLTSLHSSTRPDFASPLQSARGVFANMAFAVSYCSEDSTEKDRVLELIQANGGLVLEKGFDELFVHSDLADSVDSSTPKKRQASPGQEQDALVLSSRAQNLGFVALIADRHSRRAKYVQALALSLPCLSGRWILDSVSSNMPLKWSKYLLPAGESTFLSGAVRSRTLSPYPAEEAKLQDTVRQREKLLSGGRVLLVGGGSGGRKWEARRAYAFLTIALGASVVRRVAGLDSAKHILDTEDNWQWVYVEGTVQEAQRVLFDGENEQVGKKRKRSRLEKEEEMMVAVRQDAKVRIVGDEFVVQSLILGDLII